ncbi:MAG: hypothetical protein WCD89_03465, partial [Anaerocolumna sp.]
FYSGSLQKLSGYEEVFQPDSVAFKLGKTVGDAGSLVAGAGTVIGGGLGEIGGFALDATGAGAVAGVPLTIASTGAIAYGGAVTVNSAKGLVSDGINLISGKGRSNKEGESNPKTNWKSVKEYGHSFNTHGSGEKNTKGLMDRARNTGNNQGQWLDNQKTAEYLKSLGDIKEPTTVSIPEGLGQVITQTGEIVPATKAVVVPSASGIKTAYPIP